MNRSSTVSSSITAHLIELRNRLLFCFIVTAVFFLALIGFASEIYTIVATPILELLPNDTSMIATGVATPFLAPFKLTFFVAFILALPVILYHAWRFLVPALYESERLLVLPLLISSVILFYIGVIFAYFVVFPMVFAFFTAAAPEGVAVMTDISSYLDFVLKLFIAFGMTFEIPIAIILMIRSGIVTPSSLVAKRPYVIVSCFIVGMLLTPPDVLSQVMLAIPMWLFYEAGIVVGRYYLPQVL